MPDQKKKNRRVLELHDLKPKQDARGGISANFNINASADITNNRSTNVRSSNRGVSAFEVGN